MNKAEVLHRLMNHLPAGSVKTFSRPLSGLAYFLHEQSSHKGEIHEAIASALHLSINDPQVSRLVKFNFQHLLRIFFEVTRFDQLKKVWNDSVTIEGFEHYEKVRATGRGVVLFSGHVGNWELLISGLPLVGIDQPYALGWKQPASEWNDLLDRQRLLWGTQILWAQDFSEVEVERILTNGGTLFVLSDRFEQGKTKVQLFGQPIGTPAGPVLFARKYNAALMPIHTYREGSRHRIILEPPLTLEPQASGKDLTPDLQMCMNYIEKWIRQHPEQWIWIFKRGEWKLN